MRRTTLNQRNKMKLPNTLLALLRLKRPHGGTGEQVARQIVLQALTKLDVQGHTESDDFGNVFYRQGVADGRWFTAHLDTVHREDGVLTPVYIQDTGCLVADDAAGQPAVLGADDAAGVYLLLEMIQAGVPGNYAFFLGEECGGLGSSHFIDRNPQLSATMCVSFDRRGTRDIITHQGGYRTCSEAFALALSGALNMQDNQFNYRPDDGGLYTDSKEFAGIVSECTNVSVGYYDEHTRQERLDINHLMRLRDAVVSLNWEELPIVRVPVEDDCGWGGNWNKWWKERDTPSEAMGERIQNAIEQYHAVLPKDVLDILDELQSGDYL